MRTIRSSEITHVISDMCIEANLHLSKDMKNALLVAREEEQAPQGKKVLETLLKNLQVAAEEEIPICQDTGMAVVFLDIGQDVHIEGEYIEDAVNEGVRDGYNRGYLRKSVVSDPIIRENTRDNTPAVIHTRIVKGDRIKITVAPKGFGSENCSRLFMLKPADGVEGIKNAIVSTVKDAGPNACPPIVVGVGIGGDFEESALMAKRALTRNAGELAKQPHIKKLEQEVLQEINHLNIGPAGLKGNITALAVNIEAGATHIAGLPVAVNLCCHVNRHISREL